PQLYPSVAILP
ncbi:hypothetical protein SSYM_2623, partial [Serratia symbiotica str. Tucson]